MEKRHYSYAIIAGVFASVASFFGKFTTQPRNDEVSAVNAGRAPPKRPKQKRRRRSTILFVAYESVGYAIATDATIQHSTYGLVLFFGLSLVWLWCLCSVYTTASLSPIPASPPYTGTYKACGPSHTMEPTKIATCHLRPFRHISNTSIIFFLVLLTNGFSVFGCFVLVGNGI